jgi:hypothetical protein
MQLPTPPAPPTPPGVAGNQVGVLNLPQSPTAVYQGYVEQRSELRDQLETLQDARRDLSRQLQDPMVTGADRAGLEQHVTEIDARITALDKQIASADAQVAQAASVPGAVVHEPPYHRPGPPEEAFVLGGLFIVVVFFPLAIAYSRRLWRRGGAVMAALPGELMDRLTRLDQSVDSIAVEVERIGEGQRFVTRVLSERMPDAVGGAQRVAQPLLDDRGKR